MDREQAEAAFTAWLVKNDWGAPEIPADGAWHNFALPGDHNGKKHGSAKLNFGDRIEGVFKDFRDEANLKIWRPANGSALELTDEEREAAAAERERNAKEKKAAQDAARQEAINLYYGSPPATLDHQYLKNKNITDAGELRISGNEILVPIYNCRTDELQTVQRISPEGDKRWLKNAVKTGGYCLLGSAKGFSSLKWNNNRPIIICEGYATAYAVYKSLGLGSIVVMALDKGNLKTVAMALRTRFPLAPITFGADNDPLDKNGINPGVKYATEAALEGMVDGKVAIPPQTGDFWDLRNKEGDEAVRKRIEEAKEPEREAEQQIAISARKLPWRERTDGGKPTASLHNARLALNALGIECSCDTFHNKILMGFRGEDFRHELQSVVGEVSDNAIIRLRQIMSDQFGFDMTEKHTRDAVISLALEHCFNPVCDMLAKAEAEWDGVARLDRMAVDYLSCADTPFNRAAVRKTMIAAVRRPRKPGCKFDSILVLEADEGWNKSSAFQILACGDENFSDEKIIGKESREVQEQLASVWIHENAELAGMRKADIETVKAFASRTTDRARPAYGHFLKKQPRHGIEVGSTNSDEYLQSQTGNRRFWPLKLLKPIDLEKLQRDVLLLWGEAAHYESAGESIFLPEELWAAAAEEQEKRRVKDPWEDILADIDGFNQMIIHKEGDELRVKSSDLLANVLGIPEGQQNTSHLMKLAHAMKANGWLRNSGNKITIGGKRVRGYYRPAPAPTGPTSAPVGPTSD